MKLYGTIYTTVIGLIKENKCAKDFFCGKTQKIYFFNGSAIKRSRHSRKEDFFFKGEVSTAISTRGGGVRPKWHCQKK